VLILSCFKSSFYRATLC